MTEDKHTAVHTRHDDAAAAAKLGVSVDEVVITRIAEEDLNRISKDALTLRSRAGFRMSLIVAVMGFNMAGYGIDWAVVGGLNAFDSWHEYFGFGTTGVIIATITGMMSAGTICGAPFLALGDVIGRRGINFLGNAIVVVAAIMQSQAPNIPVFIVGRFLLGFGTSMCSAPQYMAEIAPVHLRGLLVGIFGACFQIGSMLMNGVMMSLTRWTDSDWQWRLPLLLQGLAPLLVCITIYWWCPESPRYLVLKNRSDEARAVVARYMTTHDDINNPIVPLVIRQMEDSLENSNAGLRAAWDFRVFFTRAVARRTFLILLYSLFQQWNGGGIIGYYLTPALETVGIDDALSQLGINLGLTATYFIFTAVGAYIIDIFRRRTLIFAGLISFVVCQVVTTILSWRYNVQPTHGLAVGTVLFQFIYQICSASLIATMHNLYPVELLSLPLRSKGMGLYNIFQGCAGLVQSYGIGVGIGKIGYKIWVVYIVYNMVQLVLAYFLFPETSKLSLEEIDSIFETPGQDPVKLSLKIEDARKERERLVREEAEGVGA